MKRNAIRLVFLRASSVVVLLLKGWKSTENIREQARGKKCSKPVPSKIFNVSVKQKIPNFWSSYLETSLVVLFSHCTFGVSFYEHLFLKLSKRTAGNFQKKNVIQRRLHAESMKG